MNAKALALGVATALSVAACATTTSPTGRTQYVGAVSQAQLDQLGLQAFTQAKAETPLSRDAAQNAYVGCVVRAVSAQLPAPWNGLRWEYALFDNNEANAWALPGGKIGVYTGIFKVATSQDQLAAVIAHEIGHVIARHHDERITRQIYAQTGLGVAGALAGSRYGEAAQQTTGQLGGALLQGAFLLPKFARTGIRSRCGGPGADGQGRVRSRGRRAAVAQHGRRRWRAAAAVAVHPPRPRFAPA